jgi:CRP-like cAMP-binding protein
MLTARREVKRRVDALRRIPVLAGCTPDELARIDRLGTQLHVEPGRTLIREGAVGRECFVTIDGIAVAERAGCRIGTIGSGSIAGEMALLDHTTRNATVVAGTPMQLLVLTERELDALLGIAPCVATTLGRIADERRAVARCGH